MEVPEYFIGSYFGVSSDYQTTITDQKPGEQFVIEDLLDFSNNEDDGTAITASESFFENVAGSSLDSPTLTVGDSCNSSFSAAEQQFSGDLCVPCEDLAELEWLSNFVEDSFSADREMQLQSLQLLSAETTPPKKSLTPETFLANETPLPGKARSKRSRAAPGDWTTRLLHLMNPKKESSESTPRNCLHCAAEKTPQWRTGPMGPKTLCNACGVRFKSGRLVAEYRPAASPTFVSAKHSNSHRKVLELRRQKEFQRSTHHQFLSQTSIFGVSNGADDFLINRHGGPDFSHLI